MFLFRMIIKMKLKLSNHNKIIKLHIINNVSKYKLNIRVYNFFSTKFLV